MDESVENILQDDAASDAGTGENFYKSQKEVDIAFRKRLEHERKKWEEEINNINSNDDPQSVVKKEADEEIVQNELNDIGKEIEPYLKEIENEESFNQFTEEESNIEAEEFAENVLKEVSELEQLYDDLDLKEDFENPLFLYMLESGEPLKKVYDYFNPQKNMQEIRKDIERQVTENIRARNSRPSPIAYANSSSASYDVTRLSQKDIEDIDRRVKRGERIVL